MIIYNKDYKIIGIDKKTLGILEYHDLEDFLSQYKDIDEIIQNYPKNINKPFIQNIIENSNTKTKFNIKTKSGKTAIAIFKIDEFFTKGTDSFYGLELVIENVISQDKNNTKDNISHIPEVRLPILKNTKNKETSKFHRNISIDEAWLEKNRNFLNLEKDEFISYMNIFIRDTKRHELAIKNAIITHNIQEIKKITKKIKETAIILHITPLVKIFTEIQNSNNSELNTLILNVKENIDELQNVLSKYQENV
ncbi:hypothetical protein BFG04_02240 [Campylobacter pinnipediorum subsp. pinnipediorum]|uniref:Uncharacterized protein n=1 Tax=Campylobacter pinnipediorum subsp. pinnipediorum TaxID=1660067 RepID=A0AAX0LB51_9BACT|nr:hypothetical protein [Campylobacter pinnipediorum]OPA78868.1 hypothetical protein BFG04_02240 [Campylobacter pinnipediorum subsp. pinnipediorum]